MPIYEYRCLKCGAIVSVFGAMNDPFMPICPACGGNTEKIISAVGKPIIH